jgi:hypothetical protein
VSENVAMMICQEVALAVAALVVFGACVTGAYKVLSRLLD